MSITRKTALILNYTGNVYHWGCYGTSTEIYDTLRDRGYAVTWQSVRTTHGMPMPPSRIDDFGSAAFAKRFFDANVAMRDALTEADVVVVNGEGTLHGTHAGPRTLLYLMFVARHAFNKPVHLINHSCYPSGADAPNAAADQLYGTVLKGVTHVVARETISAGILSRLGVACAQGFDCLPRFIARHGTADVEKPDRRLAPIVVSGGVSIPPPAIQAIARAVARAGGDSRLIFLTGAKAYPASEDRAVFEIMQAQVPRLEWCSANSMEEWLRVIRDARCLVSARFHHTIAAISLRTPFVAFRSNTPKIEAVCDMLRLPGPIGYESPDLTDLIGEQVAQRLAEDGPASADELFAQILALGARNFEGL